MPSGNELLYSMEGSLWRQKIGSMDANEITHPTGAYDHQPDVAPDGRSVVFTRYDGKAFELWRLDLETGREQALTTGGGVNLEPRISPDGKRIAFVSTEGSGHFNLKIADLSAPASRTSAISSRHARAGSTATTTRRTITSSIRPGRRTGSACGT